MFGPVNVNEALTRVRILRVHAIEPQDASCYKIFGVRQWVIRRERHARFENCSRSGVVTDFFRDAEVSKRRFHASFLRSDSKTRTGNWIRTDNFAVAR